jgi:DNA-binding IclR family transcriptional regulator
MVSNNIKEIIHRILSNSEYPLTIEQIAKRARVHRVTASKYLAVMEAEGSVRRRDVSRAKLYSLKNRFIRLENFTKKDVNR